MASLSDILSTLQNGVVAINNFGTQLKTTLTRISTRFGNYLLLSGGTLTGDLTISKATPELTFNKTASGQHEGIVSTNGNLTRWFMSIGDNTAEGGANAGSNFTLYNYNDAGVLIGPVFNITRSNGAAIFATNTVTISSASTPGANLLLQGDGGVTPNKYIRSQLGNLEFVNSIYGAVIATLTDAGELSWTGSAWTAFTPTLTAAAGVYTTAAATGRYKVLGKTVVLTVEITITTVGTGTNPQFTLPVTPQSINNVIIFGSEYAVTGKMVAARAFTATTLYVNYYDNTSPGASGITIRLSGTYEAA